MAAASSELVERTLYRPTSRQHSRSSAPRASNPSPTPSNPSCSSALRPKAACARTSDVNIVMVFSHLDLDRVKAWRSQVELLVAAIDLQPLILLEDEIAAAAEAFAVKYFDILHRRRVLHGTDPFAALKISDEALQRRVSQVLLNLALRLRHTMFFGNDTGRTHALVDAIGPLRASAVALQELTRQRRSEPREALLSFAAEHGATALIEQLQALRISGDPVVADSTRLLGELIAFIRAIQAK